MLRSIWKGFAVAGWLLYGGSLLRFFPDGGTEWAANFEQPFTNFRVSAAGMSTAAGIGGGGQGARCAPALGGYDFFVVHVLADAGCSVESMGCPSNGSTDPGDIALDPGGGRLCARFGQ